MKAPRYLLPAPLATLLARLPAYPGSWLFARALDRALAPHLPADVRAALEGRKLRLRVTDAQLAFDVEWRADGFIACPPHGVPDLSIGAAAHDLLLLARRQEDPDTLFFSRRLELEGDTELGLLVKNTLDALDASAFDLAALLRWRRAGAA
ncbi:MAG: SCP2 sterol-binding domain-containing protein [Pseudomonadota bacterium]|nr:SCP2 sterol-binding domain-containing protein [Pseudomonadota bacterium]